MKKALKQLLIALDKIFDVHEEVGDTAVREAMRAAIDKSFIAPEAGYALPEEFGMFTPDGNKKVRTALQKFLAHPEVLVAAQAFNTPWERLAAFQDRHVESGGGHTYDEYFGHADKP